MAVAVKERRTGKAAKPAGRGQTGATPVQVPKLVVISASKGGVGKTSVARALAVAAAHAGLQVAMVDLDPQKSLRDWWSERPDAAPQIAMFEDVGLGNVQAFLDVAREQPLDIIIVDTPPGVEAAPEQMEAVLKAADLVLVPSQHGPPDVMAATRWLEHLNVLGVSRFAAVLNRIQHNVKTNTNTARLKLNAAGPLVPVEIPQYEVFNDSFGLGVGPQEIARSPATDYVEGLWAFVRREIGLDR